jgi:hypothetical protein
MTPNQCRVRASAMVPAPTSVLWQRATVHSWLDNRAVTACTTLRALATTKREPGHGVDRIYDPGLERRQLDMAKAFQAGESGPPADRPGTRASVSPCNAILPYPAGPAAPSSSASRLRSAGELVASSIVVKTPVSCAPCAPYKPYTVRTRV